MSVSLKIQTLSDLTLKSDSTNNLCVPWLRFYSGAVAGAREALICGVPSLCISFNWWLLFLCFTSSQPFWNFVALHFEGPLSSILYVGVFFFSRKKDVSCESDLKDAVDVSLPLIHAALRDIEKGTFPKNCCLNIEIPSSPLTNKVCFFNCNVLDWRKCVVI